MINGVLIVMRFGVILYQVTVALIRTMRVSLVAAASLIGGFA